MRHVKCACLVGLLTLFSAACYAQMQSLDSSHVRQPGKDRPELPEYLPQKSEKGIETPLPPPQREIPPCAVSFELKGVRFERNTVFSDERLQKAAEPFLNRPVTMADLEEIRYRITRMYVDAGYINSGALIKSGQSVDDGVVVYVIREGRLDQVTVSGNKRLRSSYIKNRLWPDPHRPFNIYDLQKRFQLLLEDPLIDKMDGRIRPGVMPGQAELQIDVARARPYELRVVIDNYRPPSTGAENVTVSGTGRNITGYGDALDASVQISDGAQEFTSGYTLPVNARCTSLSLYYAYGENTVIEEPLDAVDIESRSETIEFNVSHPLIHDLRRDLSLGLTLSVRNSETWLLDMPFSFTTGAENGKSKVSALRFIQSYQDRTAKSALSLRSTLSVGVDMFDATIHSGDRPDSQFVSWLGQFQYARRIGERFGQVILRGDVQLSDDNLLSLEKMAVGGANAVRGYRENELVRDNGCVLSLEWRYPLMQRKTAAGGRENILELAPFIDYGAGWDKDETIDDHPLFSAGAGLIWTPDSHIRAEVWAAHDIEPAAARNDYDFQDDGVHFRLAFTF